MSSPAVFLGGGAAEEVADEESWRVSCSDDELSVGGGGPWHPPPEQIVRLYTLLAASSPPSKQAAGEDEEEEDTELQLEWKCNGRRSPSPLRTEEGDDDGEEGNKEKEEDDERAKILTEFDFDDLPPSSTALGSSGPMASRKAPIGHGGSGQKAPKGSGQKRVASFNNVMFGIRRQMKMEQKIQAKQKKEGSKNKPLQTP